MPVAYLCCKVVFWIRIFKIKGFSGQLFFGDSFDFHDTDVDVIHLILPGQGLTCPPSI
jgi:hypothetical protein